MRTDIYVDAPDMEKLFLDTVKYRYVAEMCSVCVFVCVCIHILFCPPLPLTPLPPVLLEGGTM